ncbi:MAG: hypothetical protein AAFU55_04380, partial [Pseudomonadota bacterium]
MPRSLIFIAALAFAALPAAAQFSFLGIKNELISNSPGTEICSSAKSISSFLMPRKENCAAAGKA